MVRAVSGYNMLLLDLLIKKVGGKTIKEVAKEMERPVEVCEYPRGSLGELSKLPITVKECERPKEKWQIPCIKVFGSLEGRFTFYGKLEGPLTYGMAEAILIASKRWNKENVNGFFRVYVYPGLPCYFVLKRVAEAIARTNMIVEIISVDNDERYKLFKRLGTRGVPAFEVNGKLVLNEVPDNYEHVIKVVLKEYVNEMWKKLLEEKKKELDSC